MRECYLIVYVLSRAPKAMALSAQSVISIVLYTVDTEFTVIKHSQLDQCCKLIGTDHNYYLKIIQIIILEEG